MMMMNQNVASEQQAGNCMPSLKEQSDPLQQASAFAGPGPQGQQAAQPQAKQGYQAQGYQQQGQAFQAQQQGNFQGRQSPSIHDLGLSDKDPEQTRVARQQQFAGKRQQGQGNWQQKQQKAFPNQQQQNFPIQQGNLQGQANWQQNQQQNLPQQQGFSNQQQGAYQGQARPQSPTIHDLGLSEKDPNQARAERQQMGAQRAQQGLGGQGRGRGRSRNRNRAGRGIRQPGQQGFAQTQGAQQGQQEGAFQQGAQQQRNFPSISELGLSEKAQIQQGLGAQQLGKPQQAQAQPAQNIEQCFQQNDDPPQYQKGMEKNPMQMSENMMMKGQNQQMNPSAMSWSQGSQVSQ